MHRCSESAGKYKVEFDNITKPFGDGERKDEFWADIGDHLSVYGIVDGQSVLIESAPKVSQHNPYEGELS